MVGGAAAVAGRELHHQLAAGRIDAHHVDRRAPQRAVGAEAVVLLAFLWVAQDGVGLVDLLEALLGLIIARIAVGVILLGELAEALAEVRL